MISKVGIQVDEAQDGQEAIAKVRHRNLIGQMYKLIIMDIEMPIKNGWNATKEIVELFRNGTLDSICPIVAHTAFTDE